MKLYYAPGACSLADHIALHEAGLAFQHVRVDLKTKTAEDGSDFRDVNPKGYVPALALDSGEVLTENVALLDWIAQQSPTLAPEGFLGRTRQLELLAFISTELHKSFKPFFASGSEADKAKAAETIGQRLDYLAGDMKGDFLTGGRPSVADFYLFVMLLWAKKNDLKVPDALAAYRERIMKRDAVRTAMTHEGLLG